MSTTTPVATARPARLTHITARPDALVATTDDGVVRLLTPDGITTLDEPVFPTTLGLVTTTGALVQARELAGSGRPIPVDDSPAPGRAIDAAAGDHDLIVIDTGGTMWSYRFARPGWTATGPPNIAAIHSSGIVTVAVDRDGVAWTRTSSGGWRWWCSGIDQPVVDVVTYLGRDGHPGWVALDDTGRLWATDVACRPTAIDGIVDIAAGSAPDSLATVNADGTITYRYLDQSAQVSTVDPGCHAAIICPTRDSDWLCDTDGDVWVCGLFGQLHLDRWTRIGAFGDDRFELIWAMAVAATNDDIAAICAAADRLT